MTPRHVLTAEHCFLGAKWVKLGRGNTDEVLEINAFNVHPKAREWPVVKYDIAVVRLKQASKQQPPARLGFDSVSIGAPVVVRGRGVTAFGRINRPKQVREMNGTVVAASACEQALREPNPIHESMMCISGVFVCRGDSGGAVSIVQENGDEVVVALQSLGVKECNESAAVYTRPASSPQTIHQPSLSPPEDAKQPYSCANMPPRPSLASTDWDTKATVRGFGRVQYDQKADILRESSGYVLSNDDCINMNDPSGKAPNDLMCIIGPYPCMGDAGGPVTIVNKDGQEVVVAIQSWTSDKCMGDFGGYVRLSNAVEFLKPFLRGQDVCQQNLVRPTLKATSVPVDSIA
ncbi:unnamed protein product [Aphanomyces euteiches]